MNNRQYDARAAAYTSARIMHVLKESRDPGLATVALMAAACELFCTTTGNPDAALDMFTEAVRGMIAKARAAGFTRDSDDRCAVVDHYGQRCRLGATHTERRTPINTLETPHDFDGTSAKQNPAEQPERADADADKKPGRPS